MVGFFFHIVVLRIGLLIALYGAWFPTDTRASNLPQCTGDYRHNCQGILETSDGRKYVGEFKDNKRHGQGTSTHVRGDKYVGEYKEDKKNGQGFYTWPDGSIYAGEWRDDKINGLGAFTFANGGKYVGEQIDGKKHGRGRLTFASGSTETMYDGEWRDDKFDGQGTLTFADGRKYEGEFRNNAYDGSGIFTFPDGRKYAGEWKDGEPIIQKTSAPPEDPKGRQCFDMGFQVGTVPFSNCVLRLNEFEAEARLRSQQYEDAKALYEEEKRERASLALMEFGLKLMGGGSSRQSAAPPPPVFAPLQPLVITTPNGTVYCRTIMNTVNCN